MVSVWKRMLQTSQGWRWVLLLVSAVIVGATLIGVSLRKLDSTGWPKWEGKLANGGPALALLLERGAVHIYVAQPWEAHT